MQTMESNGQLMTFLSGIDLIEAFEIRKCKSCGEQIKAVSGECSYCRIEEL